MPPALLKTSSDSAAPRTRTGGFALLITITLLSFVVLLLVGLATYTRIETAISGNTQKQAQARQNALLALDVALGQLQKHAGPDQRVTATAESFGGVAGTRYYTGVWDAANLDAAPVWLASGLETDNVNVAVAPTVAQRAELVGANSVSPSGANNVVARLMPITTVGVPGQATSATIGRYAWWVGDEGVKAAVSLGDRTASVNYQPWTDAGAIDLRDRIRQQISIGAGAADAAGAAVFESRSAVNALPSANALSKSQIAFFNTGTSTTTKVGLDVVKQNYHAWSSNNFAVLADTAGTGLRRDLSIDPSLLGAEVQAWLDYPSYMEAPSASTDSAFPPLPAIATDSLRRRYQVSAALPRISPVLSSFYLTLGVRKQSSSAPYTISLRWGATLWNPYTSGLVPENLKLQISGLPSELVVYSVDAATGVESDDVSVSLPSLYGAPLILNLPWTPSSPSLPEEQSWFPGRIFNWVNGDDSTGVFKVRDIPAFNKGMLVTVPGSEDVNSNSQIGVRLTNPTQLTVTLTRDDGQILATYQSPVYSAVGGTELSTASNTPQQLVFPFRLVESFDFPASPGTWLTSVGKDPRSASLDADWLRALPNGTDPSSYGSFSIVGPDRLLDRVPGSTTYNEDAPVFELPRAPLLSLGALQHLPLPDTRSFAVGNSWGDSVSLNGTPALKLFDQFFFSGLTDSVTPTGSNSGLVLPNPLLRTSPRSATVDDLRTAPEARSSKFLLQGGAFNVNSASVAAWRAVLRSVRFSATSAFSYLAADAATGTAPVEGETTLSDSTDMAHFFRFSQSAQETYKAEPGLAAGVAAASTANTHLFRNGVITLTGAQVNALATQIVALIQARATIHHRPFLSLEEFIGPSSDYLNADGQPMSLLEKAIADAGINSSVAEFSSQFLIQGDILTALAPVLFPRSDTFVIRTYGEAVNPATGATEGKAWCEATVQRIPEYFDPADDATVAPADLTSTLNQNLGRRFKVVSFRWLTRSDI